MRDRKESEEKIETVERKRKIETESRERDRGNGTAWLKVESLTKIQVEVLEENVEQKLELSSIQTFSDVAY